MSADVIIVPVIPAGVPVVVERTGDPAPLGISAGWQITERPRRTGSTDWKGHDPVTLELPFLLDGWIDERSVEPEIGLLQAYMRDSHGGIQPTVVQLVGPVPSTDLRWCMQTVTWGADERRASDGQRIRAFGTISFIEYVGVDLAVVLAAPPPSPAAAAVERAPDAPSRTYTVRPGDTLSAIAQRELGNAARWHEIADLNGVRDPRTLRIGQVLRLP